MPRRAEFAAAHGKIEGGEFIILALGRLGGEALTHASDLDLIYLFDAPDGARSDGAKSLGRDRLLQPPRQPGHRGAERRTAAGPLYEVDTRLRPQGAKGMLAVSLAAFAAYQQDEAWTWEHMALTRARAVYGSAKARTKLAGDPRHHPQASARRRENRGRRRRDARRHGAAQAAQRTARHQARPGRADRPRVRGPCPAADARRRLRPAPRSSRSTRWSPRASSPPDIAPAHDLLTRMLVTMRLVAPEGSEHRAGIARIGRRGLRP